ncbi:MAG: hypothetical protein K2X47_08155 [Bdellovibrionales bacterium]|nr:hypothetical protein [Bdellovibrionales bacterium]
MTFRFSILISLFLCQINSSAAQEVGAGVRAGPTMAVLEATLDDGFRLAEKAKKVIGVVTRPIGTKPYVIPRMALVFYGDRVGVYRLRQNWFKLVEVQTVSKTSDSVSVSSPDLKVDDQVAIEGVALLRVSELDAFGGGQ